MTDNPFPVRLAQETAQTITRLGAALEDAARVLLAAKLAAGRVAEADGDRARAGAEVESLHRTRDGLVTEIAAERERLRADLADEIARDRALAQQQDAARQKEIRRAEIRLADLNAAVLIAQTALQDVRVAEAAAVEAARLEAVQRRQGHAERRAELEGELRALTERVEAKRQEYRKVLEQVKAVLRG